MVRSTQSAPTRVPRKDVLAMLLPGPSAAASPTPWACCSRYESNIDPDDDRPSTSPSTPPASSAGRRPVAHRLRGGRTGLPARPAGRRVPRHGPAWAPVTTPDGRVLRRPFTGRNEIDSAAEAVAWMRQAEVSPSASRNTTWSPGPSWQPSRGGTPRMEQCPSRT